MHFELIAIMAMTSIACVLPGVFLVLRGIALMSDALSHALLPGIVIMFLLFQTLNSPSLILGASLAGMLTVLLTEAIIQTDTLKKDAAIGLVFPLFFSIGILLISHYARTIHLDMDMVILGHLIFAPFNRLIIGTTDCGPEALWIMGLLAAINSVMTWSFYKELQLSTFDQILAHVYRLRPRMLHYGLMIITSITCVCAFDIVGTIVVVALMLVPPATAYLLARNLTTLIWLALFFGLCCVWGGFLLAHTADVSPAGALATVSGCIFAIVFVIYRIFTRLEQKKIQTLEYKILCAYLNDHPTGQPIASIASTLGWSIAHAQRITKQCAAQGLIVHNPNRISIIANQHAHDIAKE